MSSQGKPLQSTVGAEKQEAEAGEDGLVLAWSRRVADKPDPLNAR